MVQHNYSLHFNDCNFQNWEGEPNISITPLKQHACIASAIFGGLGKVVHSDHLGITVLPEDPLPFPSIGIDPEAPTYFPCTF